MTLKKSMLRIPIKGLSAPIKVGSQVVFTDGSWALGIPHNEMELCDMTLGLSDDIWTVVAINVSCPTNIPNKLESCTRAFNNCIVKNNEGDIAFCSPGINIVNIKHLCDSSEYRLLTEEIED